jgi:hypothetical protein
MCVAVVMTTTGIKKGLIDKMSPGDKCQQKMECSADGCGGYWGIL